MFIYLIIFYRQRVTPSFSNLEWNTQDGNVIINSVLLHWFTDLSVKIMLTIIIIITEIIKEN